MADIICKQPLTNDTVQSTILYNYIHYSRSVCPTLRSWLHETSALIMTLSPGFEKNYTLERSYNSFPGPTCMSGCLENCQKSIPKSWCSLIQGTISDILLNYGTDLSPCFYTYWYLVSWIGEHWDFGMYF